MSHAQESNQLHEFDLAVEFPKLCDRGSIENLTKALKYLDSEGKDGWLTDFVRNAITEAINKKVSTVSVING